MYSEISNKEVKCRKPHVCGWCGTRIPAGEGAQYRAYRFEGDFVSDYMHLDCYEAMLCAPNDIVSEGWCPGDFNRGEFNPA